MFIKTIITVLISFGFISGYSQHTLKYEITIEGKVSKNEIIEDDTIYFTNGMLESKFYETPTISSNVSDSQFKVKTKLSYPHLFSVNLESEKGKVRFRGGDYFIDASTDFVEVSDLKSSGCNYVQGDTFNEYQTKFIPFFVNNDEPCKSATIQSLSFKNVEFDDKLLSYTLNNPDSYVALWALVTRIRFQGHSTLYEEILYSFSEEIKKEKLWKIVYDDLLSIRITKGKKFPELNLKSQQLQPEKFTIPEAEYILVYYWFSNCKPCLETFPQLKELYKKYRSKGFEIINISTDRANRITNWEKTIREHELNWKHLMDENGVEAKNDKIISFPTTYLLNSKGEVIEKDISMENLEGFLMQNLK